MKRLRSKVKVQSHVHGLHVGARKVLYLVVAVAVVCGAGLALVPHRAPGLAHATNAALPIARTPVQGTSNGTDFHYLLGIQPEPNKLRMRLGQRFLAKGRELSDFIGTLVLNGQPHQVHIQRLQQADGEHVTVALDGGFARLTWDAVNGALSSGKPASGDERALLERIALDSPDQFIFGQTRGVPYFVAARGAIPSGSGDPASYSGPVWDVIRIQEPDSEQVKPQSPWRTFHINASTGLLDKIISEEQGQILNADIALWANQSGEIVPAKITWTRSAQQAMALTLNGVSFSSRQ